MKKNIFKMIKNLPEILSLSIEMINFKLEELINLGYTKEEVIIMTSTHSALYSLSIDYIKNKFIELLNLGFSIDEIKKMTIKFPSLYSLSIDNIRKKREFYDMVGLSDMMILEPKYIMQSIELSYARYMFLKNIGININMNNYRILFMGQNQFEKRFGKNNEQLIKIYNYDRYLENRDNMDKKIKMMK